MPHTATQRYASVRTADFDNSPNHIVLDKKLDIVLDNFTIIRFSHRQFRLID